MTPDAKACGLQLVTKPGIRLQRQPSFPVEQGKAITANRLRVAKEKSSKFCSFLSWSIVLEWWTASPKKDIVAHF